MQRIRVILAAHGEAESSGVVESFRVSWRTLSHAAEVMRLPAPLRLAICTLGSLRKRLSGGTGSPHNANTQLQATALQQLLTEDSAVEFRVQPAFASAPPYLEDTIRATDDIDRQVVLSMIPTDSHLSCGLMCRALIADSASARERTTIVARFWDAPALIALHCAHVAAHFPQVTPDRPCCLVLALHGTVVRDERGQAPGFHTGVMEKTAYGEALRTALLAMPERPWQRVEIAYINHGVGGQWSSPALPELMSRLGSEGVHSAVVYACEHLVDGSETASLPALLAAGTVPETHCLPCLNASTPFIEFLAGCVRTALSSPPTARCCDPCPLRSSA